MDNFPPIEFSLGPKAVKFSLVPEKYFEIQKVKGQCRMMIGPSTSNKFILGMPFLRAYFSIYNLESKEVGFLGAHPVTPTVNLFLAPL